MAKSLTFSMAIDIQRAEVLLPTDRSDIKTKTNVHCTNKPSTKSGHLHFRCSDLRLLEGFTSSVSQRLDKCPS